MQRYVRMFGTPVTLLVLLAILVLGARWGYQNVVAPPAPAPLVPCTQQKVGDKLTPAHVTVQVFNGGTKSGLATTVATQLKGVGFKVAKTGNTQNAVTTTQIVGAAVDNPEVKLVAGYFPGAKVVADGRADHTVEVRVGNANTGFTKSGPASVPVNGSVCLPAPAPVATPSA